jgi:PAS domain S-box-containing protein
MEQTMPNAIPPDPRAVGPFKTAVVALGRYFLAALTVGAALGLTLIVRYTTESPTFFAFYAATFVSIWFFGRAPGLVSLIVSAVTLHLFFHDVSDPVLIAREVPTLVALIMSALAAELLSRLRDRAEQALKAAGERLELVVRERTEELTQANEGLRREVAERRRLASLVEQAADLMAISDLSGGTPIYLNKAGLRMVGFDSWEEARTRRGIHYIFPEDRRFVNEMLWPTVLEKGSWSGEMRFRHFKTGAPIPVLYSAFRIDDPETGQPVNVGNVCRDITDRKRAEAEARENERRYREMQTELAHASRVATMGQLTASIAHEVNQPIAAVVTSAEAALRWLDRQPPDLEEARQALTSIVLAGNRAADVIGRIRDLIRKAPPRHDRLEINEAILEVIELTRGEAVKNGIMVRTELADGLPGIKGDRVQLQQVILNLIVNAVEAMTGIADGRRELLVSTEATDGVRVAIRDSGPGFAPGVLDHLFDTFYTTKSNGLGLGLSICRSIIEAQGGRLWASANVPRGAIFQFTLPSQGNG